MRPQSCAHPGSVHDLLLQRWRSFLADPLWLEKVLQQLAYPGLKPAVKAWQLAVAEQTYRPKHLDESKHAQQAVLLTAAA